MNLPRFYQLLQKEFKPSKLPFLLLRPSFQLALNLLVAAVCIAIGLVLLFNDDVTPIVRPYSPFASEPAMFFVDSTSEGNLSLLVQYEGMYSNHRTFVKSRDTTIWSSGNCDTAITVHDALRIRPELNSTFTPFSGGNIYPCGLIALTLPVDRFSIIRVASGETVPIHPVDYTSDDSVYRNKFTVSGGEVFLEGHRSWLRPSDLGLFKEWNRISPSNDFRVNFGTLRDVTPGWYRLSFDYVERVWTDAWKVNRSVVIVNSNPLGAGGNFMAIVYLIVGGIWLLGAGFFAVMAIIDRRKVSPA